MRIIKSLVDDQYELKEITHTRKIARGIIYNDNNEIALIKVFGDDDFGHRDYYETPGGGVKDKETYINALSREILEEIGYEIDNIEEIGRIVDFYNLINRKNDSHYFLAHATKKHETHLEDYEKSIFEGVVWVKYEDVINLYESVKKSKLSILINNRELPIIKIALKRLYKRR